MSSKFQELAELGAGDFEHLNGSLIEHLNRTRDLLKQWGAPIKLQDAGLYHAAYGTAGFNENLVSTKQRDKISAIIGQAAEEIVYQYCACDRKIFFARMRQGYNSEFLNRFTGESYYLTREMLQFFCELTAANEIEIAIDNPEFISQHGKGLGALFNSMSLYLSTAAQDKVIEVFGGNNA